MSAEAILTTARQYLGVHPTVPVTLVPIKRGASGRTIVRVKSPDREPFIGMHWTDEREDNELFVPVAKFLRQSRLRVPEILHDQPRYRVALIEDLGDTDLHSLKETPFAERLPLYRSALEMVDKLFYTKPPKDFELMPAFDEKTYRWEQEYFCEHLVGEHLGMDPSAIRENEAFHEMAKRLGSLSKHLVHRDFQSQNMIVKDGKIFLIDFQGMRKGRQEYDLASLIYDPYMDHSAAEREELLALWEDISEERPEENLFRQCAAQRLMQALGAYGNLLENKGNEWYRPHIATAGKLLREVTEGTPLAKPLAPVLERIA